MEEQTDKKVTLKPSKQMSYEDLQKKYNEAVTIINQQGTQFNQLKEAYMKALKQIEQMNTQNIIVRLDTCFKVLDHEAFFTPDFVKERAAEIEEIMTPEVQADPEEVETEELPNVAGEEN